jgi:hypothetical protein
LTRKRLSGKTIESAWIKKSDLFSRTFGDIGNCVDIETLVSKGSISLVPFK